MGNTIGVRALLQGVIKGDTRSLVLGVETMAHVEVRVWTGLAGHIEGAQMSPPQLAGVAGNIPQDKHQTRIPQHWLE